jgi:heme/copper-type cytochrome/quinol oxidase subunit 3
MLTGLHGMHVIVGTLMLAVARFRAIKHHYTMHNHIGYESAA